MKYIRAFDIETTGLTANSEMTVIGFRDANGYDVHVNAETADPDIYGDDWSPSDDVTATLYDDEEELLNGVLAKALRLSPTESEVLVGFCADGFDLPMVRTRCAKYDISWPFQGWSYLELKNVLRHFNLQVPDVRGFNKSPLLKFGKFIGADVKSSMLVDEITEAVENRPYDTDDVAAFVEEEGIEAPTKSQRTLDNVHSVLCGPTRWTDPFSSSADCVTEWRDGNIAGVVVHNVADLEKTWDVASLVQKYIHQTELPTWKL